jgi:hypothetical protein
LAIINHVVIDEVDFRSHVVARPGIARLASVASMLGDARIDRALGTIKLRAGFDESAHQ